MQLIQSCANVNHIRMQSKSLPHHATSNHFTNRECEPKMSMQTRKMNPKINATTARCLQANETS